MLAHELRNPLASLANAVKILRLQDRSPHERQWARSIIERQVKHIARMVDDLLDVSRISRGLINLKKETIDLSTVVARAVEWSQPLLDERGHELEVTLPPEPVWLEADPVRLEQVLVNLLDKAVKFNREGGSVSVDCAANEGNSVTISVADTGIGIPSEDLKRIFERFYRVDRARSRQVGGTGLGLSIVKEAVERMGGSVTATSRLGHGACFRIQLPGAERPPKLTRL